MGHSLLSFPDLPEYSWTLVSLMLAGFCAFFVLIFIPAPYGRHIRPGWGPTMSAKWGWVIMESASPLAFVFVFFRSSEQSSPMFILGGLWCLHYGYRAFVFPFRMRSNGKRKPCLTVVLAFIFNVANGTTNAFAITELAPHLSVPSMHFFVGLVVFFVGFAINQQSDSILLSLREPNETGYKIPFGGFYRWVSAPNYLGELIEWLGFAIAACTFPALIFACFTGANLIPRALSHHRWYVENFADYPSNRKAIVPFVL